MKAVLIAAAALTAASFAPSTAFADQSIICQEQAERDCALFAPVGSRQWASCVENLFAICMGNFPATPAGDVATLALREAGACHRQA